VANRRMLASSSLRSRRDSIWRRPRPSRNSACAAGQEENAGVTEEAVRHGEGCPTIREALPPVTESGFLPCN